MHLAERRQLTSTERRPQQQQPTAWLLDASLGLNNNSSSGKFVSADSNQQPGCCLYHSVLLPGLQQDATETHSLPACILSPYFTLSDLLTYHRLKVCIFSDFSALQREIKNNSFGDDKDIRTV